MKNRSRNATGYRLTCTRRQLDQYHMLAKYEKKPLAKIIRELLDERIRLLPGNKISPI
jgi:hypothetical protein